MAVLWPLGISMHDVGMEVSGVVHQPIQNVDAFPDPTGNEAGEERDVTSDT